MTITHHPDIATLMSCAAGSQQGSLCGRHRLASLRLPGMRPRGRPHAGDRRRAVRSAPQRDAHQHRRTYCWPRAPAKPIRKHARAAAALGGEIPAPMQPLLGDCLASIPWRRIAPSIWQYRIPLSNAKCGDLQLIKAAPGTYFPDHGHRGSELTLVLAGSYHDETGTYGHGRSRRSRPERRASAHSGREDRLHLPVRDRALANALHATGLSACCSPAALLSRLGLDQRVDGHQLAHEAFEILPAAPCWGRPNGALSGSWCVSMKRPATPTATAARASTLT